MKEESKKLVMTLTKRGMLYLSTVVLLILALLLIALPTSPAEAEARTDLRGDRLDNLTVLHIGGGTLPSQMVDRLGKRGASLVRFSGLPEAVELNPEVAIIFSGKWFEQRTYDSELRDFLSLASSGGASMVMVGGTTSKFLEALDIAGLFEIAVSDTGTAMNPADDNPPLVGFRVKTVDGHTGPSILISYGSGLDDFEESLIGWLSSTVEEVTAASSTTATVLGGPYLQFCCEYYMAPLLAENPYGKLNVIVPIYKLKSDGVPNYDWYFYQLKIQSVPGRVCYGSDYNNEHIWSYHEVRYPEDPRWLVDYDPTTTSGTSTVGVSIAAAAGPSGPSVGFTWSWSYSIADVVVLDRSDYSENLAYWEHDIDRSMPVGFYTYQCKPGFTVKTGQDDYTYVRAWYNVRFVHFNGFWWSGKTLASTWKYFNYRMVGD
jgi:hypothetical protein